MSVLIKGWSIPTNGCCGCYFRTGKYCGILDKNERVWEHAERYTRPDNCPLVEVPAPHGGLIDGDKLYREVAKAHAYEHLSVKRIIAMIRKSPAVIEAEE